MKIKTVYLAGPIEFSNDPNRSWRRRIEARLAEPDIEVSCIDPIRVSYLHDGKSIAGNAEYAKQVKQERRLDEFCAFMELVKAVNVRSITGSDAIALYAETPAEAKEIVASGGTEFEMYFATLQQGKEVFLIYGGPLESVNSHFLHHVLTHGKLFAALEEFYEFLRLRNRS